MFEVITQSQSNDYQSLEILKEAYSKLGREKDVINTSKRIAQAYVQLGQLSSAILEYETVLQRFPDDTDVKMALQEIEAKAISLPANQQNGHGDNGQQNNRISTNSTPASRLANRNNTQQEVDDGRASMLKIFVDSKLVSPADFDICWKTPDQNYQPSDVLEPFIQTLADKGIVPVDKSLKLLVEKSRMAYLPMEHYDVDLDVSRSVPAELCRRWCILPFDRMSKTLLVATTNPYNRIVSRELMSEKNARILFFLAPPVEITSNLKKIFR